MSSKKFLDDDAFTKNKKRTKKKFILKASDDGVQHSESLGFGTSSVVRNFKYLENAMFRNLNIFPFSCERKETPTLLGPLLIANINR
jgi:hypothetical protein